MNVLVIGGGGREHALIKSLKNSPEITKLYALPGNGGIAKDAICENIKATDLDGIVRFATENNIDYCVVAPDDPLAMGAVDRLNAVNIPCFGPTKAAAEIEGSKVFAKHLMEKYNIPTASCHVFDDMEKALAHLDTAPIPTVIKADGLALGKGVSICFTQDEAKTAIRQMMQEKIFGDSGRRIVVEEFLEGPEVSVLCFTDGHTLRPMVSSMDHKRAHDGDLGSNTGGMGTIAPNPYYTDAIAKQCMAEIFMPTIEGMKAEGRPFKGCLYFGLMLTKDGPKVIEYNCRFGDPETQVVLPLLKSDLFKILRAVSNEKLDQVDVTFFDGSACCVVLASGGYPGAYERGKIIALNGADALNGVAIYHSGTALDADGNFITAGGRVLGVSATDADLKSAIDRAYDAANRIDFEGAFMRKDIGHSALALGKVEA